MLAIGTLLTVLDSIAAGVSAYEAAMGIIGSEAGTVGLGAARNVTTLAAVADVAVQADLAAAFQARAAAVLAGGLYGTLGGTVIQRALDRHYGSAYGSLNAFLANQDKRVHPNLRKIGFQVDGSNAFTPAEVDPAATFAVTGAGAGTFTHVADVDTTQYGKANLAVRTTTLIGAQDITATLTMKKLDGTTEAQIVSIPHGTANGITIAIGVAGVNMYIGCSAIGITGGTGGDGFKVVALVERAIAL